MKRNLLKKALAGLLSAALLALPALAAEPQQPGQCFLQQVTCHIGKLLSLCGEWCV